MKTKFLLSAALVATLGLASCGSEDAKLAGEVTGTWKGQTVSMMNSKKDHKGKDEKHNKGPQANGGEMSCTPTLTFVRTDGTNGGTINISADYVMTQGIQSETSATPILATVNGSISASGTWMVEDGDEIIVNLDPAKTVVNVDTSSVSLNYARLTDAPQDSLALIKDRVASNIEGIVKPMLTSRVQHMRKLDDVKIVGNVMTLEAGHNKISFNKQ